MISKNAYSFCKDDVSLIENYKLALNDKENTWDIHHRLESDLGLSMSELIEQGLYFNRPASELIFMTHSEHMKLHNSGENSTWYGKRGKEAPMYGKNCEDYMTEAAIKERRKKISEKNKGENNPNYGKPKSEESNRKRSDAMSKRPWMNNGIIRVRPKTQEIEHYRKLGYQLGWKLNN